MRIAFCHNRCMDYTRPLFELLSDKYDMDFLFEQWDDDYGRIRSYLVFKTWQIPKLGTVMPGLGLYLLRNRYDLYISGDFDLAATPWAWLASRLFRKPLILWCDEWDQWKLLSGTDEEANYYRVLFDKDAGRTREHGGRFGGAITAQLRKPLQWLRRHLRKLRKTTIARSTAACVAMGSKQKAFLISLGARPDNIFLAPYTSITAQQPFLGCEPDETNPYVEVPSNSKVVLYLSRVTHLKGTEYLLRAFARLARERQDAYLVFAGTGPAVDALRELAQMLGVQRVVFHDHWIQNAEKVACYRNADVFVLPALGEPWGAVVNEAMHYGKPVIVTDQVGAADDLVRDGVNGFVVPAGDVDALYRALKRILDDEELARAMGERSAAIESQFTLERQLKGFMDAIEYALRWQGKVID